MLFLLNEVVLNLGSVKLTPKSVSSRFKTLPFQAIVELGQELYAEHPMLFFAHPDRAHRLAMLITAKAPVINAALFIAPRYGCRPDEVSAQFASVDLGVIHALYGRQQDGLLDTVSADRQVWRRLAA